MENSRLLSLPKELRLEIWTYVLTDPSVQLTLHIWRKTTGRNISGKHFPEYLGRDSNVDIEEARTNFDKPRKAPINLNLLRTSQLLYDEGIPILYRSVRFYPCDLEGIFPLFLETISPFAQSYIRFVKLSLLRHSSENFQFHWAITCAQVAKLSASLRRVDIEGYWPLAAKDEKLNRILNPLVKIRALKKFDDACNDVIQELLNEAEKKVASKPVIRKALIAAETNEELRRGYGKCEACGGPSRKRPRLQDFTLREKIVSGLLPVPVEEKEIAANLKPVTEIKNSENDLQRWEMVGEGGEAANPKKRTASILDDETWNDTASTIIAKDSDLDASKESDDWEVISKPSSPN